jgi:hypothetical protein
VGPQRNQRTEHSSPLEVDIALPIPQQSLLVNLISQKDAILDGVDNTLRFATCPRVTRQPQASNDCGGDFGSVDRSNLKTDHA